MPAEMLDAIRNVVREELVRTASPWLDTDDAAAYLGSTSGTLKNWRAAGRVPRYRILQDRLVRYHRDDLDALVLDGTR